MQDIHKRYMLKTLGVSPTHVNVFAKYIQAGNWSHNDRNRWFFSNTVGVKLPEPLPMPWDIDVIRPPAFIKAASPKCHLFHPLDLHRKERLVMMPWLRSRGLTDKGNIIFTTAAYHPSNLLYKYEQLGGIEAFDELWLPNKLLPNINWALYPPLALALSLIHI